MKFKIGYTAGVFDLFHIGHLRLLNKAKKQCQKLIVGVTTDELVSYKFKKAVIPFEERIEIIKNIRSVDSAVPQDNMNKMNAWEKLKFDVMYVGDDWKDTSRWNQLEVEFHKVGVQIVYFPYTQGTSSTLINEILLGERK